MEVHFPPELEKKLNDIAVQTGRPAAELVRDVIADYLDEIAITRESLDGRYDDIRSGRVKLVPGEEVESYFREKSAARRMKPGS